MAEFDKTVPFDPGYTALAFSFPNHINFVLDQYYKVKSPNQKKFLLVKLEKQIIDVVEKATAFYLGCILWGGFVAFRFKDSPKPLTGNQTEKFIEDSEGSWDCAYEVKAIQEFIKNYDRDCKYFLKRSAKISEFIPTVLESYTEFAQINDNFRQTKLTSDVKIPKVIEHFSKFSNEKLDELKDIIYKIIEQNKIENLLDVGFYE